jgi:uncharacterized protein
MKYTNHLILLVVSLIYFQMSSCQNNSSISPGYRFDLFKNTPVKELARYVESEDTIAIGAIVIHKHLPIDYQESRFGSTLLTLSVLNNKTHSIYKLLELGSNPNIRAHDNSSPFLQAIFLGDSNILQELIKYGADVNSIQIDTTDDQFGKKKNYRNSALGIACSYGNLVSVKALVDNGVNLGIYKNENSPLSFAVLASKLDIVKYLMIEKKMPVPDYVFIRNLGTAKEKKLSVRDILMENEFVGYPEKQKQKAEILAYLNSVNKK